MLESFRIGYYTDEDHGTGATVILCEKGAVGGVSVRGSAPATRETDLLSPVKTVDRLDAVVLSGGSAFGLEAGSGVMQYLFELSLGYPAGKYTVPIVSGASIYDLEFKDFAFPDKKAGYEASKSAKVGDFRTGFVGGGTGATVSKIGSVGAGSTATRAGQGVRLFTQNNLQIAVIAVVNAVGDVVKDGEIILGAKTPEGGYFDCKRALSAGGAKLSNTNTTIACIMTNAKLTKVEANVLADIAHDGFALALSPSHTRFDGDAVFVLSCGEVDTDINILSALIPTLVAEAIQSVATGEAKATEQKVPPLIYGFFKKMFKKKTRK